VAEELVQDALVSALETWPRDGIPRNPAAWLMTAARRKAIDRLRREARHKAKLSLLAASATPSPEPDDRLRLIFTCCHPALGREAQVALTLRAVAGLTTAEIAHAFLAGEAAVAQRIVRAKRKIVEAGIPYRVPHSDELAERLDGVLAVLYLTFNEGYLASSGDQPARRDLTLDAEWLCSMVVRMLPDEPEALGLLALMRLHQARAAARFDAEGHLVLLRDQDRSLWDATAIARATELIEQAARRRRLGPYQVQAAIVAVHAEAPSWDRTDWLQILGLYQILTSLQATPVVRLNRALALWHVAGPEAALAEVDALSGALDRYHHFHAARAELLRDLGRPDEARAADSRAYDLTANPAERALFAERLAWVPAPLGDE
jgi:RNA polymerase sigma-70 factor (ECF subfamily)